MNVPGREENASLKPCWYFRVCVAGLYRLSTLRLWNVCWSISSRISSKIKASPKSNRIAVTDFHGTVKRDRLKSPKRNEVSGVEVHLSQPPAPFAEAGNGFNRRGKNPSPAGNENDAGWRCPAEPSLRWLRDAGLCAGGRAAPAGAAISSPLALSGGAPTRAGAGGAGHGARSAAAGPSPPAQRLPRDADEAQRRAPSLRGETRRGKGHRDEALRVCPAYVTRVGVKRRSQRRDEIFFFIIIIMLFRLQCL
ncbi:uncharacterized protein LOC119701952 [Motacilla alba alba]|uniref:uncharacterized protein LOC119701952 n=1 Tax=Motacilla alba alba TaxID=1094192 RepID=UPI0018D59BA3|nr:uncharacterized protein LOC119701952 [Motacilla alba alba]